MTSNFKVSQTLQSLLATGDEVDRCYAIRSLARIQDGSAVELLVSSLRDDDIDVCVDAAEALSEGEFALDTEVTQKIIESLLNDPDGEIKVACVRALVRREDKEAIPHLLGLVEKPLEDTAYVNDDWDIWWDMQLEAIRGLGKMQIEEAVPALQRVLATDDFLDIENEIFNTLATIGGSANEYLFTQLKQGTARYRRRIAKALGGNTSTESLKPLARALKDADADVREATLLSLLQRNAVQYLPAIIILFRDSSPKVRQVAVKVAHQLSQNTHQQSEQRDALIEKLLPLLTDTDALVVSTVLNTLTNLAWHPDKEQQEYLVSLLKTYKGDAFASLCDALLRLKISDAVATLLYLLRHNELQSEEKMHALITLGGFKIWNKVVESVIWAHIFDDNKTVRVAAIEALAELDSHLQQEAKPANDNQAQRLPIEMIAEAVQGNLEPPLTKKVIPVVAVNHTDKKDADSESAQPTVENSAKEDQEFFNAAKEQISKSISAGEKPLPLSTLDSIVISSVEKQMECQQQEPLIESPIDPDADLDEFVALTEENAQIANWLLNKEVVDIDVEIQRLAARFLAQSSSDQAIPILLSVLDSDDSQLKREAILSLGSLLGAVDPQTEQSTLQIAQLHNVLIQELSAEDRDLRIAAATVLGDLGTSADSQVLLEALEDKEVAMRMQLLRSLINIAMRSNSKEINHFELAEEILKQLDNNNETGIHRAAVEGLVTLFKNKLNGSAVALKESAIKRLINAGLSGTDGQVKEMSWGLNALDKELSTTHLIRKMEQLSMSVERRYVIEMLGELHSA